MKPEAVQPHDDVPPVLSVCFNKERASSLYIRVARGYLEKLIKRNEPCPHPPPLPSPSLPPQAALSAN